MQRNRYLEDFLFLIKKKYQPSADFMLQFRDFFPILVQKFAIFFSKFNQKFSKFSQNFQKMSAKSFLLFQKVLSKILYNVDLQFPQKSYNFQKIFSKFFIISTKHLQNVCKISTNFSLIFPQNFLEIFRNFHKYSSKIP